MSSKIVKMIYKSSRAKQFFSIILCSLIFLSSAIPAQAQSGYMLLLYPPELDQFPKITLYLDAYDAQGKFIPSLDLNSFTVLENGVERPVNEVQLLEPGLHTIIAFNLGATMGNRPNTSVPTRYEEAVFAVASWLNGLESDAQNQYTLSSNEGLLAENVQEKGTFTYRLQNFKPNLFNFQPDFTSLTLALNAASKPNLVPQSKQAILYITPLPLDQSLDQLPALQARAVELGVPVHVWLIAPETASNAPAVEILSQLSASTGGNFLFYSENGQMPDPEDYVSRLRSLYRLRFTSKITQTGTHTIQVTGTYGNQRTQSQEQQFNIDLNLPTIFLTDLPGEIKRAYENSTGGRMLQPSVVTLAAKVVFPDGYERQLEATRLYVDGEVVAQNTEPPFDFFGWPLEDYLFTGEHLVSAEVEDILGFRSISPQMTVLVSVESPYPDWLTSALKFLVSGGWIALAVLAVGGTIYAGLRLRRRVIAAAESGGSAQENINLDPLEQTVPGLGASGEEQPSYEFRRSFSGISQEQPPKLVWAGNGPSPFKGRMIEANDLQTVIGSDPAQSDFTIEDPSISTQHACLVRQESGALKIADLGSETGTWVNYAPVSSAGTILNNGDLVQIGKLPFRYRIGNVR